MSSYQVIARKFRPKLFSEVVGQEAIVTTLKNAIAQKRVAHAYLFSGSRGTGKTTLARLFAKALNCPHLTPDFEPCNHCSVCRDISAGNSLDVLEIDGASHRGIEDIRQINETIGYSPASHFKIYLIDEVHMLTKEAFNALLKTLEEPPEKVKFFFATTEAHKIPHTILSRCQRFNLNRITSTAMVDKLSSIAKELQIQADTQALHLIAQISEGGLRDAESLMDQIISYENKITLNAVNEVLGLLPVDLLFQFDEKGAQKDYSAAFELAHALFSSGKNITYFFDLLLRHYRTHLLHKLQGNSLSLIELSEEERARYQKTSSLYSKEQCLHILDLLIEAQQRMKNSLSQRLCLEMILLQIVKSHQRQNLEQILCRLEEMEAKVTATKSTTIEQTPAKIPEKLQEKTDRVTTIEKSPQSRFQEDPTPSHQELPKTPYKKKTPSLTIETPIKEEHVEKAPSQPLTLSLLQRQSRYDTLMQFAARELRGAIIKNKNN